MLEGDSSYSHYDIGCQASRVIFVCGECARLAAVKASELLCGETEKIWGAPARLEDGVLRVGSETISLAEVVKRIEREGGTAVDVLMKSLSHNRFFRAFL